MGLLTPLAIRADRDTAWRTMLRTWPSYAEHDERTARVVPVFRLVRR